MSISQKWEYALSSLLGSKCMAGLLTRSGFRGLPSSRITAKAQWHKYFGNFAMEHTAAGLFRIFTGFPFNHYTDRLREPMRCKGTNSFAICLYFKD